MNKFNLLFLSVVLMFSLVLGGCSGGSKPSDKAASNSKTANTIASAVPRGTTGTISTGKVVAATSVQVPSSGGTLAVSEQGTPITGLELTIPSGSYPQTTKFEISYAPIEKHSFGEAFNPLTPLISIKNGGAYSTELMRVKIPVQVPADNFAMGFIYDSQTKTLEGLPTLAQDENSITVGTRHFTDILISCISDALIKKDVDSVFRPGIDDWQFTNRGSFIAPGGHCAGQSMSAMWYYIVQPDGKDLTLNGRYDNNAAKPATPKFWEDDSLGYRLASTTQEDMDWESWGRKISLDYISASDEITRKLFAYSIQLTGQPQMVEIWNTAVGGGHAMIVYRVVGGSLYIADPNYPGDTERRIEYAKGKFTPYESGANADEIAKGNSKKYDQIVYIASSSILDFNKAAARWQELKDKTIGNDRFPDYKIIWTDDKNQNHDLIDGYVSPSKLINFNAESKSAALPNDRISIRTYRDGIALKWDAKGNYELLPGENKLGIMINGEVDGKDKDGNPIKIAKYIDFKYLTVTFGEEVGVTMDPKELNAEPGKPATVTAKMAKPPAGARYDWHIAGTVKQSGPSPSFTYTYPNPGFYALWVEVFDAKGQKVDETNGRAVIAVQTSAAPVLNNLQKLQQMKSIKGSFFGRNDYSIWVSSGTTTQTNNGSIGIESMPITWSGTSFNGKVLLVDNNGDTTDEITGVVSEDGNTLLSLTFSYQDEDYHGYGKGSPNYSVYSHSIQIQNIPLNKNGEIGKGLVSGASVQSNAVKLEYKETTFKNGARSYEKTYISTDWTTTANNSTPQIGVYFGP